MVDLNCKSCKFFNNIGALGQCRRYPVFQNRHFNEWCGEFTSASAEIIPIKRRGRPAKEADNDSTSA